MPRLRHVVLPLALGLGCLTAAAETPLYGLPAQVRDFPDGSAQLAEMQDRWQRTMAAFTAMAIAGNPWTNLFDAPRANYVDPAGVAPDAARVVQPITWTAFPNRVNWYFHTSQFNPYQVPAPLLYPLADEGRLDASSAALSRWIDLHDTAGSTALQDGLDDLLARHPAFGSSNLTGFAPVTVPTGVDICPVVDWSSAPEGWIGFGPGGPRGWKDEYNEWVVTRNAAGDVLRISFTAENPEYWFTLWEVDPERVLALYRQLVGPQVQLADLYLRDADGAVVADHAGRPAYNPLNRWNYGNVATPEMGGAVHLTSPPNTVGAEMYLGGAATMLRDLGPDSYGPAENLCAGLYGGSFRNSDPNIGMQGNQVTRNLRLRLTLTNPIALYMQYPDFSNYGFPEGATAADFFTVVRGRRAAEAGADYDQILHAVFAAPPDLAARGITVSDVTIGGVPILYGSQVAETFNQALAATAFPDMPLVDDGYLPAVQDRDRPNGWAQPLVATAIMDAVDDSPTVSQATVPLLPLIVAPGATLEDMTLQVISGAREASIDYLRADGSVEPGIAVTRLGASPPQGMSVTGKHGVFEIINYRLKIDVGPDVAPGQYGVRVTNPGNLPQPPTPGNLIVRATP